MDESPNGKLRPRVAGSEGGPSFIDVFAGCGGLSLGLSNAGWKGRFAIEKNADAFGTLAENLVSDHASRFTWPDWLPKRQLTTSTLLKKYGYQLSQLEGKVTLMAGGPPCQGFSLAGRRLHSDPRNSLFRQYLKIVQRVKPTFLVLENVQGFAFPFRKNPKGHGATLPYSSMVTERLKQLGYVVFSELVSLSDYGVPQTRRRFILIAILEGSPALDKLNGDSPFDLLRERRAALLQAKGLRIDSPVSVKEAIGDLETAGKTLRECQDPGSRRFKEIVYATDAEKDSEFIRLMRKDHGQAPTSIRLPRHKPETIKQFQTILDTCKRGQTLHKTDRTRLNIKKQALTPLDPNRPAATVTTLPDDMVHYSEPRILTVRENARLQTFPDWFTFSGKYTTGGKDRKRDCPRYTQVGNAVPPLFAEFIGTILKDLHSGE